MYFSVVASLLLLSTSLVAAAVYQPSAADLAANDIHVLQYALILEDLEYNFYNRYQGQFTVNDFLNAGLNLTAADYTYFNLIRDHEKAHVDFLVGALGAAGRGTSSCTYNFGVTDVLSYIRTAQVLENTGVSAYDGAINNIYNPGFAQAAATVATIEARHASYLNKINNAIPFPSNVDTALDSTAIRDAVFGGTNPLASCEFVTGFALPTLLTVYPVQNASDAAQPTPATLTANDINVLQYALFLEHLEAAFYQYLNNTFTASSFSDPQAFNYIQLIGAHETAHVNALTSVISSLGATPFPACTYNFAAPIAGNSTIALQIAVALENTGVGAYDGAVSAINNAGYKQYAATIATVEARHASYVNYLYLAVTGNGNGPVNGTAGAFDLAYDFATVNSIVNSTGLITSCPASVNLRPFQVLVVQPYTNSTFTNTGGATTGTVAPTTTPTTTPTTAPTTAPTPAPTRPASSTSGASIISASVVVVALLAAFAAL